MFDDKFTNNRFPYIEYIESSRPRPQKRGDGYVAKPL
jgi:hypothetical protein